MLMNVRRATQNDFAAIVNLINDVFGTDRDLEWFTHFHLDNPSGESILWLAQDDKGDVVSYRSIVRFKAYYLDQVIDGGQLADACTRPDYRGRGIYSKVHAKTMEDFFGSGGDMIYAFPVPSNYRILTSRFGFQHVADIRQGFCPLSAYRTVSVMGDVAKQVHKLMFRRRTRLDPSITVAPAWEGLETIAFSDDNVGKLAIDRSQEFLKWRTSIPGRRYWMAVMDECNYAILGEAVVRGLRTCTVLDIRGTNQSAKSRLLNGIRNWADSRDYEGVYSWLSRNCFTYVGAGFVPVHNQVPLVVQFNEGSSCRHRLCRREEWDLRLLDTDSQ
jgi:predicted N-acetyltransferase YhbS